MPNDDPQYLIDALDDLLDLERTALLAGDVDQVGRLLEEKENLIGKLNDMTQVSLDALGPVHAKVTRNQTLIAGALEGIRAVADRMAEMRAVRRSLQTYDQSGTVHEIVSEPDHRVEKRA